MSYAYLSPITNRVAQFHAWLVPMTDEWSEKTSQSGYARFIIFCALFMTAFITPVKIYFGSRQIDFGMLIAGMVIGTCLLCLALLKRGFTRVAYYCFLTCTSVAVAVSLFYGFDLQFSMIVFVPLILVVASALLGSQAVILIGLYFDLLLLGLYYAQQVSPELQITHFKIDDLILLLAGITFLTLFLYVIVKQIHYIHLKSSQQAQSLQATVAELQSMQESLTRRTQELLTVNEYLRSAQRQLVEAEKMAALGSLVAGISHEVNTPLGISITAITTLAAATEELEQQYQQGPFRRSVFDSYLRTVTESNTLIVSNLQRVDELMQSFKHVAVDQITSDRRAFCLRPYLEEVVRSLEPKLRKDRHTIRIQVDEDLRLVSYPGAFAQIMTNLVINSLVHGYFKRQSGLIEICAYRRGERLHLQYRDDGQGIAPEYVGRIYEPFFTTARDRGGTGLGLHIVYNLVTQRLQGSIRHESVPAHGVTFFLDLPLFLSEDSVLEDEEMQ